MAIDISTETTLITGEEFYTMSNVEWSELVEGKIVRMSPPGDEHGGIQFAVGSIVRDFVRANKLGKVRVETGVYITRNPDTVRSPDVLYISSERYATRMNSAFLTTAPDLVVEVISPENTFAEMNQKLREYFAIGVRLVWLVDPDSRSVLAYRAFTNVREFTENDELPGDDVLPGFSVKVATLFED